MNPLLIATLFAIIAMTLIITLVYLQMTNQYNTEIKQNALHKLRHVNPDYLSHSNSCYNCEDQYDTNNKWRGQSSKCYDCEKETEELYGENAVYQSTKQKCFDC